MQVFITGVSRGLGKALAEEYLKAGHRVTGIGRFHDITLKNFSFISCDLGSKTEIENLKFTVSDKEVLLINNAGILGIVKRLADQEKDQSQQIFQVNTLAPIELMRQFLIATQKVDATLTVLNISSGAGRRAIPSWAVYCASKAALDLFSETVQLEEIEQGRKTKIYSLAPGIIDTEMQNGIRESAPRDFSQRDNFVKFHAEGGLKSPSETARAIKLSLENETFDTVICRLP